MSTTVTAKLGPRVVTFGEIMLRLAAPEGMRLAGAQTLEATFGGGEANVAASLAGFGLQAAFVSRVPANDLGAAAVGFLRGRGVETSGVESAPGRLGLYFLEPGASQRPSRVIYDRADSAIALAAADSYPWQRLVDGAAWFHTTGITPAISAAAAEAALAGVRAARAAGATVSIDLNYRAKLWGWGAPAGDVMAEIVAEADVLIGNEEDADKVFGIRAPGNSVADGTIDSAGYASVAAALSERFPRLHTIAFTQRGSISASENTWSGVLWTREAFQVARSYRIAPIVDRVGAGDSFAAGLIYALLDGRAADAALEFAVAASCLKHTIRGDVNQVSVAEVDALVGGSGSGRVER
jgi:2-dehydro-3-deoxygluconokinase